MRILEPEVSTAGDLGRLMVTILGMVAEMELRFIRDRQHAGIEAAKARQVYKRRKRRLTMPRSSIEMQQGNRNRPSLAIWVWQG